jgi:predicted nucleotidyltransferase
MTTATDILSRLGVTEAQIADFCRRFDIVELAVFGSAARNEMRPDSDVDVMVQYAPGTDLGPWMGKFTDAQEDLKEMFGRDVDLIEKGPIKNPFKRHTIMRDLTVIYAA